MRAEEEFVVRPEVIKGSSERGWCRMTVVCRARAADLRNWS
jgi:hypothetical protein